MGIHKFNAETFLPLLEEFSNRLNLNDREKEYLTIEAQNYHYDWTDEMRENYQTNISPYNEERFSILSRFQTMTPEEFKLNFEFIENWCYTLYIWDVICQMWKNALTNCGMKDKYILNYNVNVDRILTERKRNENYTK